MQEWFELWDVDSSNMIGAFRSEAEALAEVRGMLAVNGSEYAADLALARRRDDGGDRIADGAALARLADSAGDSLGESRRRA